MADEIVEMVPMDKCGVFTGKSIEDAKRKAADDFQIPLKDIKFLHASILVFSTSSFLFTSI